MPRILTLVLAVALAQASAWAGPTDQPEPSAMTTTVRGTFDVTMTPRANTEAEGAVPSRMLLDKRYHGALEATARGQMLAFRSGTPGSAAYVAMELVEGSLDGRSGSFVLHHRGVMDRGAQSLSIDVVPDSGTGELVGLGGSMQIEIEQGAHSYVFEYRLAPPAAADVP